MLHHFSFHYNLLILLCEAEVMIIEVEYFVIKDWFFCLWRLLYFINLFQNWMHVGPSRRDISHFLIKPRIDKYAHFWNQPFLDKNNIDNSVDFILLFLHRRCYGFVLFNHAAHFFSKYFFDALQSLMDYLFRFIFRNCFYVLQLQVMSFSYFI